MLIIGHSFINNSIMILGVWYNSWDRLYTIYLVSRNGVPKILVYSFFVCVLVLISLTLFKRSWKFVVHNGRCKYD